MTPLSLVPEQARYRAIDYPELCERLVEMAL
jgi:D-alanine-D-alanine ligase-like ATP-grasp enzyme